MRDRLVDSLRRCCRSLPDQRRGLNATYDMADFAMAGFAPFFMRSPSFLANQRHLETGQGRSNCQTLFGMRKIPGDSLIRAKLDAIEPAIFYPMFADLVAELEQCGGLDAMRYWDGHVLIGWRERNSTAPTKSIARIVPTASVARTRSSTFTPCSPPPSWRPGIIGSCRWNRSSSSLRTGTTSRIVKACRPSLAGGTWRAVCPVRPGLSGRRSVLSPTDMPGRAGYGRALSVCLRTGFTQGD
jgi:hypothetical protein